MAMMVITLALGDSAPDKGMIDAVVGTNWFWGSGIPQTFILIALIGSILWIKQKMQSFIKRREIRFHLR